MRILHLLYESEGDYFGIGGVGTRAYEIYRRLKDRHDITLLCKKYPGAIDGEINGLRHIFVGTESTSLAKTLLSYAYCAARYVKKHGDEYDVIIEEFSPAVPTFLHFFSRRPIILQVQGYTGRLYFRKYNLFYALTLVLLEQFRPMFYTNFMFVNPGTAKRLGSLSRRAVRIASIPNGIPSELLALPSCKGDHILYLGRIDIYGKGLDLLLCAYCEFHKAFPGIRLVIAGDGRDREAFQGEVRKLSKEIRNDIELAGWVSGRAKTEIIRNSVYVVFPSRHEVQPVAVLEAMACGKAVVVSDIPEFGFVTGAGAGISFETDNAASLARSMKDLLRSDERKDMGNRGRDFVKDFPWEGIALKYEEVLCEVARV